jgi:predicted Zn-dependent peptidase
MKRFRLLAAVLLIGVLSLTAAAITIPKVTYTDARLRNGLRVIISPDRAAPVVSVAVAYNVGSRNERKGRTGFAHLFEHLMFKGSENVADGELAGLIENYGGSHNGQTDKDHTLYFEQVPSNQLDMVLFLEADRMRAPAITQENVNNQREAVKEERRLRMDNQPYGRTSEFIGELLFENFANEHSIIGSMADLDAASLEDFTNFFRTYYAPNNAVLAIAGDVDAKTALDKVRKYFESIPSGQPPPSLDTTEPVQKEERRTVVNDPLARLPLVDVAYQIPGGVNADMDALSALSTVMGSGRSSRLYENLVRQQVAVQAGAGVVSAKGPTFMYLEGMAGPGKDPAAVETAIYAEIEKIQKGPIQEWELDKARNGARRGLVGSLASSLQRAILLARFTVFYNDPAIINTRYERIASLKIEDLQRVARQYLVPANRAVVITVPAKKPGAADAPAGKGGAQ